VGVNADEEPFVPVLPFVLGRDDGVCFAFGREGVSILSKLLSARKQVERAQYTHNPPRSAAPFALRTPTLAFGVTSLALLATTLAWCSR